MLRSSVSLVGHNIKLEISNGLILLVSDENRAEHLQRRHLTPPQT